MWQTIKSPAELAGGGRKVGVKKQTRQQVRSFAVKKYMALERFTGYGAMTVDLTRVEPGASLLPA